MQKYYYLNACATPCAKVYAEAEPLAELPKHWRQITEEEYKAFTAEIWEVENAN